MREPNCFEALCLPALVAAVGVAVGGCGAKTPPTYPVEGKVVFADGSPLSGGLVEFESVPAEGMPVNARGIIQSDGSFRLTTYAEGDGALAGKHRAIVVGPRPIASQYDDESNQPPPKPPVDRRFESYTTSGLEFTVTEGKNEFLIKIEPPQ